MASIPFTLPELKVSKTEEFLQNLDSHDETQFSLEEQQVRKIITALEAKFWTGEVTQEFVKAVLEKYQIPSYNREEILKRSRDALKKRGIELSSKALNFKHYDDELDPVFVLAVNLILTTTDKRTTAAKLKALNVSPQKWEAYLRNYAHRQYFEKRLDHTFGVTDYYAQINIARSVESGDLNAIKYYHELTGKFQPQSETKNLQLVILRLLEILAKYVEPSVIDVVAKEFDKELH